MTTPEHAGRMIADELKRQGMTQAELARRMGRPLKTINEIIHGKASITPETALQLEMCLGLSAITLLTAQAEYQLSEARQRITKA